LKNEEIILVFPEGGRTWDGNIAPFLKGSLMLAQRTKSAIMPAAISGAFDAFPRTHKYPWFWGKFRVVYGQPMFYDEFKDLTEEELRQLCEGKVAELFQEAKRRQKGRVW